MEKNLLSAVSKKIEELLNNKFKELSGEEYNLYKTSTILDWNFDEFKQVDKDGYLIINDKQFHERYIPVIVENLLGDVEPIPNMFVANVTIPISMIVGIDNIDITQEVLYNFLKDTIGQFYDLDFGTEDSKYNIAFVSELPDFSEFNIAQGEMNKTVDFSMSAIISDNVYWGNQIEYYLSMDGGNTYQQIYKIDPSTKRSSDLYTNQIIGEDYAKSTKRGNSWNKSFSMICQNNSLCRYLITYADFGEKYINDNLGITKPNLVLKIVYRMFGLDDNILTKPVLIDEVSYSDNIGDFISIGIELVDKL